jgi:hypothetical protein
VVVVTEWQQQAMEARELCEKLLSRLRACEETNWNLRSTLELHQRPDKVVLSPEFYAELEAARNLFFQYPGMLERQGVIDWEQERNAFFQRFYDGR